MQLLVGRSIPAAVCVDCLEAVPHSGSALNLLQRGRPLWCHWLMPSSACPCISIISLLRKGEPFVSTASFCVSFVCACVLSSVNWCRTLSVQSTTVSERLSVMYCFMHRLTVFPMKRTPLYRMDNKLRVLAELKSHSMLQSDTKREKERGRKIKDMQIDLSLVHTTLPHFNGQHSPAGVASANAT